MQSSIRAEAKPETPVPGRFRRVGGATAMFSEPTEIIRIEPERDPTESLLPVRFGGFAVRRHKGRVGAACARFVPVRADAWLPTVAHEENAETARPHGAAGDRRAAASTSQAGSGFERRGHLDASGSLDLGATVPT